MHLQKKTFDPSRCLYAKNGKTLHHHFSCDSILTHFSTPIPRKPGRFGISKFGAARGWSVAWLKGLIFRVLLDLQRIFQAKGGLFVVVPLQGTITSPTKPEKENHRLKSAMAGECHVSFRECKL